MEDCCNNERKARADDPTVHHMACDAKRIPGDGEDPVVQTCDGYLVEHEDDLVHDIGPVEPFSSGHSSVGFKSAPVSAVTVHNSYAYNISLTEEYHRYVPLRTLTFGQGQQA